MSDTPSKNPRKQKDIQGLLARIPFVEGGCELDLLVFFYRHPRSILTNEQLSALVGYDTQEIARSIDKFIEAGLLERAQNPTHAARMFHLVRNGQHMGPLKAFLDLASTHQGRRDILRHFIPVNPIRRKAEKNGGCMLLLNCESNSGTREVSHAAT